MKARQNEVLLSWLEEEIRRRDWAKGPSKKAMRCAIELFQNLTKHASDVNLKVGYDEEGHCHLRSENDVAPTQWDGLRQALDPVVALDMASLKARRLAQLEHGARTATGGAGLGLMDLRLCSRDNLAAECIPFESGGGKLVLHVVLNPKSD
ncbi:MAG: DUF6272 family protein [Flavobacteriales bacterium]